jgi:hypothetical protein
MMCQADVEQYLGGAEAEVESTLKGFQEAIAYVYTDLAERWNSDCCFTKGQQVPIYG